jgi:hypothetical protein
MEACTITLPAQNFAATRLGQAILIFHWQVPVAPAALDPSHDNFNLIIIIFIYRMLVLRFLGVSWSKSDFVKKS